MDNFEMTLIIQLILLAIYCKSYYNNMSSRNPEQSPILMGKFPILMDKFPQFLIIFII